MKIVIDANTLSLVFNPNNQGHSEFKPVFDCINSGPGTMTYGGTKYEEELKRMTRILGLILELQKRGSVCRLERSAVDRMADDVAQSLADPRLDDPHIVAIVIVGKCAVVCSVEERLHAFLKDKSLYPKRFHFRAPKIYTGLSSAGILQGR